MAATIRLSEVILIYEDAKDFAPDFKPDITIDNNTFVSEYTIIRSKYKNITLTFRDRKPLITLIIQNAPKGFDIEKGTITAYIKEPAKNVKPVKK